MIPSPLPSPDVPSGAKQQTYCTAAWHIALARESAVYTDLAIGRLTTAPVVDEDQARDLSRKRLVESIYERFEITPRRFETDRFARWSAREPVE